MHRVAGTRAARVVVEDIGKLPEGAVGTAIVVAASASHVIVVGVAVHGIGTRVPLHVVVAIVPVHRVVAALAVHDVVAGVALHRVVPAYRAAGERLIEERHVEQFDETGVGAGNAGVVAGHEVDATVAEHGVSRTGDVLIDHVRQLAEAAVVVVAAAAYHVIGAAVAVHDVGAGIALHVIVALVAVHRVVAALAVHHVRIIAAVHQVIPTRGWVNRYTDERDVEQHNLARTGPGDTGIVPGHVVYARTAGHEGLAAIRHARRVSAADHVIIAIVATHGVGAAVALHVVIQLVAEHHVVIEFAEHAVFAVVAVHRVDPADCRFR